MKKILALILIGLMSINFLLGCSNEKKNEKESTEQGSSDVSESNTENKTDSMETLKVAMLGKDVKVATVIIAKDQNLFEEEGLNVEFEKVGNLSDAITALSLNKIDVLPFGAIPSLSFISQGTNVEIFGGTIAEGSEGISRNNEKVTELSQFEGKKIGSFRMETGHMVLKGLLRKNNINAEFIYLENQQAIVEAVNNGEVDYGMVNSGFGYIAQKSGLNVAYHVGDFEADFPCCRQSASPEAYANKKDALIKFETALLRAYNIFLNDKDTAVKALCAYSGQDEDYINAIFFGNDSYKPAMKVSLDPNRNKIIDFYETMKGNGDIDANTNYKIEDFIDSDIYETALKNLIDRGESKDLYQKLLDESMKNNH